MNDRIWVRRIEHLLLVIVALTAGLGVGAYHCYVAKRIPIGEPYRGRGADVHPTAIPGDDLRDWPCWQVVQDPPRSHQVQTFVDDPSRVRFEADASRAAPLAPGPPFQFVRDILPPPQGSQGILTFEARTEDPAKLESFEARIENLTGVVQDFVRAKPSLEAEWKRFEYRFYGTAQPVLLRINFTIRGPASVEIRNVECRRRESSSAERTAGVVSPRELDGTAGVAPRDGRHTPLALSLLQLAGRKP